MPIGGDGRKFRLPDPAGPQPLLLASFPRLRACPLSAAHIIGPVHTSLPAPGHAESANWFSLLRSALHSSAASTSLRTVRRDAAHSHTCLSVPSSCKGTQTQFLNSSNFACARIVSTTFCASSIRPTAGLAYAAASVGRTQVCWSSQILKIHDLLESFELPRRIPASSYAH